MRSCRWPPCISKRVCIVNIHSCVTQYGNAIMHPSALNSAFPEKAPQRVCVCRADAALLFSSPRRVCFHCSGSGLLLLELWRDWFHGV